MLDHARFGPCRSDRRPAYQARREPGAPEKSDAWIIGLIKDLERDPDSIEIDPRSRTVAWTPIGPERAPSVS